MAKEQVFWNDEYLIFRGYLTRITYLNKRALKSVTEFEVILHDGFCMVPVILHGDLSVIAHNVMPQDGDIAAIEGTDREGTCQWYHVDGQNAWIESPGHGKTSLEGLRIEGVVVAIARFVGALPQCELCPSLSLLGRIIGLCRENPELGQQLFIRLLTPQQMQVGAACRGV